MDIDAEALRSKLAALKSEHRDLDDVIARLSGHAPIDQLQLQRLKKRKLLLKDRIAQLESELLPDIIA
jgi:hypothetical protein